jgi:hypothetical protein
LLTNRSSFTDITIWPFFPIIQFLGSKSHNACCANPGDQSPPFPAPTGVTQSDTPKFRSSGISRTHQASLEASALGLAATAAVPSAVRAVVSGALLVAISGVY